MKIKLFILTILSGILLNSAMAQNNIYQFTVKDISGLDFKLESLKGKKVLIVNTASECGLTPQYEVLEEVYQEYKDQNFTIIGFPANNFGAQEPGTNQEIASFCKANYGVTFPMMSKISVKGNDQHELYKWLTDEAKNGVESSEVVWNFQKYMIDENGNYVGTVSPKESPASEEIINWIAE